MTDAPNPHAFDVLTARGLLFQLLIVVLVVGVLLNIYVPLAREPGHGAIAMITIYAVGSLLLLVRGRLAELEWRRIFGTAPTRAALPLLAVIVPLILLTWAAVWLVFVPLSYVVPELVEKTTLARQTAFEVNTLGEFVVLAFAMVVAAPFCEEMFFRGFLMHRWARRWGTPAGVALSSAAFAVGHSEWVGHFVTGVVFALLYLRTRSLWVPILTHAVYNAIFAVPIGLSLLTHEQESVESLAEFRDGLGLGLLTFAAGVFLMWYYKDLYWPNARVTAVLAGPVPYDDEVAPGVLSS